MKRFGLKNPIFEATASYGHFPATVLIRRSRRSGRTAAKWNARSSISDGRLDAVDCIRKEFGL